MIEHLTAAIDRWHTEKGKSPGAIHLERLDPESGLPHLAHAACCLLFALELDE